MNREMLPFILFLLYSDDLKNQADRIILGISNESDNKTRLLESKLLDSLKDERNALFDRIKEYLSQQYDDINHQIVTSSDPKKLAADLKVLLNNEENRWYNKLKIDLDNQSRVLLQEISTSSHPKEVAAEIMDALKTNESDFFDRAANYVFMYYAEIMDEIKANSEIVRANQTFQKEQLRTIGFIKESVLELKEKINALSSHR
jgi:hypothetical protein